MAKDNTSQILAALCYIFFPVNIVLLLTETKDRSLRYDAINGLGFMVAILILSIVLQILFWVPVIGWLLGVAFTLGAIVLMILYAVQAYERKRVVVPVVTDLLKKNVKNF